MVNYNPDTKGITMIAKDTADFLINVDNYLLDDGDVVYFTVNAELENPEPLIQKKITKFPDNKILVHLSKTDTDIPIGNYFYDVQIDTVDGRVDTVLGPAKFKITGGATF